MNQNSNGRKIFENPVLESLTRSNPYLTASYYSLLIALLLWSSSHFAFLTMGQEITLYISGLLTWSLLEYILHRYVFHIDSYLPSLKRFHFMVHGVHHEDPRDRDRLFMPPVPGTLIAAFLFGIFYIILGYSTFAFMAGILNGYLLYSYIHYSVHTKPVYKPLAILWKHHALHHYKYHNKAFGVSSPLWDIVFGTMPPAQKNKADQSDPLPKI